MKKILITLVGSLVLGGCATSYAPHSFWNDGGFTETRLQPGLWQIRFRGNEFTSAERTADFAMLRGAELCLQQGDQYIFVGDVATQVVQSGYIPGSTTSTTTGSATAYGIGGYVGAYGSSTTYTTSTPPTAIYRPESGLTVACASEQLEGSWDASFLARSLREKYNMGG